MVAAASKPIKQRSTSHSLDSRYLIRIWNNLVVRMADRNSQKAILPVFGCGFWRRVLHHYGVVSGCRSGGGEWISLSAASSHPLPRFYLPPRQILLSTLCSERRGLSWFLVFFRRRRPAPRSKHPNASNIRFDCCRAMRLSSGSAVAVSWLLLHRST